MIGRTPYLSIPTPIDRADALLTQPPKDCSEDRLWGYKAPNANEVGNGAQEPNVAIGNSERSDFSFI